MYCKNCDIEIYGDSEICPLCHGKLTQDTENKKDTCKYRANTQDLACENNEQDDKSCECASENNTQDKANIENKAIKQVSQKEKVNESYCENSSKQNNAFANTQDFACDSAKNNKACKCGVCDNKQASKDSKLEPSYYPPKRAKHKSYSLIYFSRYTIYLAVALATFLICVVINYCTSTDILWCYIVGAVLLYLYATVRYTFHSFSGVGTKIFWQAAFLTAIAFIVGAVFGTIQTNIDYTLPAILTLAIAVQAYQLLCNRRKDSTLYVSSLLLPSIGFIPIVLWGCGVATALSIAVIPATLAVILIALDLALGYKYIIPECKKIFHH